MFSSFSFSEASFFLRSAMNSAALSFSLRDYCITIDWIEPQWKIQSWLSPFESHHSSSHCIPTTKQLIMDPQHEPIRWGYNCPQTSIETSTMPFKTNHSMSKSLAQITVSFWELPANTGTSSAKRAHWACSQVDLSPLEGRQCCSVYSFIISPGTSSRINRNEGKWPTLELLIFEKSSFAALTSACFFFSISSGNLLMLWSHLNRMGSFSFMSWIAEGFYIFHWLQKGRVSKLLNYKGSFQKSTNWKGSE